MIEAPIDEFLAIEIRGLTKDLPYLPSTEPDGSYPVELRRTFGNGFHKIFQIIDELQQSGWEWDEVANNSNNLFAPCAIIFKPYAEIFKKLSDSSKAIPLIIPLVSLDNTLVQLTKIYCSNPDAVDDYLKTINPSRLGFFSYNAARLEKLNPLLLTALDEMILAGIPFEILDKICEVDQKWLKSRIDELKSVGFTT